MLRRTLVEATGAPEITSLVHDLRNPLSAIHGGREMPISSRLSEPQVHRTARNLYGASVRMKELVKPLQSDRKKHERTDVLELVARAVDKIALVAEAQLVQIVQNVPANLLITLDRQRIQRVSVNLFVNALDLMPGGGSIRISAIPERHSAFIKIRDTGLGIAPEIRDQLFRLL